MHIKYKNKVIHTKFYVIDKLPYKYLLGRSLIRTLGYELIRRNEIFEHRAVPEFYGTELGDSAGEMYPLSTDTITIDKSKLNIITAKDDIIKIIEEYAENISKGNHDIGTIDKLPPVNIELRDDIPVAPIANPQYIINRRYYKSIKDQIIDLKNQGKIELSNSPWRSSLFGRLKKTGNFRIVFDYRK